MQEEKSQQEETKITRRDFLLKKAPAVLASTMGPAVLGESVGLLGGELAKWAPEIVESKKGLRNKYKLNPSIKVPVDFGGHKIKVSKDSAHTLVMGEIGYGLACLPIPERRLPPDKVELLHRGVEVMSETDLNNFAYDLSRFGIVVATDGGVPDMGGLMQYYDETKLSETKLKGILAIGIPVAGGFGMGVHEMAKNKTGISRREFNKMLALGGSAGLAGGLGAGHIFENIINTDYIYLNLSSLDPGLDKDLKKIFAGYNIFLTHSRNAIMALNENAGAALDFTPFVRNVQLSFETGHLEQLRYFNNPQSAQSFLSKQIWEVTEKHIALIAKYSQSEENADAKLSSIAWSLAGYYSCFPPITLNINHQHVSATLNEVRESVREAKVAVPAHHSRAKKRKSKEKIIILYSINVVSPLLKCVFLPKTSIVLSIFSLSPISPTDFPCWS